MPVDQNWEKKTKHAKNIQEKMLDVIAIRKSYIISMLP